MGITYGALGRYKEAIEVFKKAVSLTPNDANAHFGLGLSYLSTGNRGPALDEYKILKTLDEDMAGELFDRIYK
jgi:Flp pilus assembly protein TadD